MRAWAAPTHRDRAHPLPARLDCVAAPRARGDPRASLRIRLQRGHALGVTAPQGLDRSIRAGAEDLDLVLDRGLSRGVHRLGERGDVRRQARPPPRGLDRDRGLAATHRFSVAPCCAIAGLRLRRGHRLARALLQREAGDAQGRSGIGREQSRLRHRTPLRILEEHADPELGHEVLIGDDARGRERRGPRPGLLGPPAGQRRARPLGGDQGRLAAHHRRLRGLGGYGGDEEGEDQ
ncbi:MAG: hypothetical protein JRI25_29460 [Deltaproteobacteria bacterium]|nr:hypothetical protein [Deltaproteobacteria bacterium]